MSHGAPDQVALIKRFNKAQTELVIQTSDLPLGTLADMVETGAIDLAPGFQRRERWDSDQQSALIESFLLNVPVPPVYLAEEEDGTYSAIDGKQRLRAIADFIANRLRLRNLDQLNEADGLIYSEMPTEILNALRLRPYIRVVTLLKQTDSTLKYEVFLRLNRGGETLNNQEIRNVAFRGKLNDEIYRLAESDFLKKQLKITSAASSAYKLMNDAEYVLRFLTLRGRWRGFSGKLAPEMNAFMADRRRVNAASIRQLSDAFARALSGCERLWGDHAFKRPEGDVWRDQLLAGMFDAQMLSVDSIGDEKLQALSSKTNDIINRTQDLFQDKDFDTAVRAGTNTPARIRYRVQMTLDLLENL